MFWWTFIVGLDSAVCLKTNRFTVINRSLPYTIIISSAYWSLFELINIRIQNWFYINLPEDTGIRYVGYFFAYGTVIPAIMLVRQLVRTAFNLELKMKPLKVHSWPVWGIVVGIATFLLTLFYPTYFFPFTWISPLLVLDGINYKKGKGSLFMEIEKGEYGNILSTLISGLICGILWEFWNFWAVAKWVYTVPFFEGWKVFEMPLPGYLGFSFFALETVAFMNFLDGLGIRKRKVFLLLAFFICLVSFPLIDRHTVFSYRSKVDDLYFLAKSKRELLKSKNVIASHGIDKSVLSSEERKRIDLMHLYGLGLKNLLKLEQEGIDSAHKLALLSEEELSRIIGEKNLRRIRIFLKEAKRLSSSPRDPSQL